MPFTLGYTAEAQRQKSELERSPKNPVTKAVLKALRFLANDPRHAGLRSHRNADFKRIYGVDIWESYAQNNTPRAWRIFWYHGPGVGQITVVAILPHPDDH